MLRPKSIEEANAALRQCRIKTMDLSNMKIADSGCIALSEGLKLGATLQNLYLWHQKIGPTGISSLGPVVSNLPLLSELNLFRNHLGDSGCQTLSKHLAANSKSLNALWLGDNKISELPADVLKIRTLRRLYLNENRITKVPHEAVLSTSLEHIDLDFNHLVGYPNEIFMYGITHLPGPRWELLKQHLLQLNTSKNDDALNRGKNETVQGETFADQKEDLDAEDKAVETE